MGKNLVYMPECHSTNDLALQMAQKSDTPEGTLVITSNQTAGRGQRGNTWEAQIGLNFTLSIIIKPTSLAIKDQFYLNIFTSLAIVDYLSDKAQGVIKIKWPNDILIDAKKVCGILIENQIQGSRFSNSVVGIGLNVNQTTFAVPTATSLSMATGQKFDLPTELDPLMHALEVRYLQLRNQQYDHLLTSYLARLHWLHEKHTFVAHDTEFNGTITGIDDLGRLKISTENDDRYFGLKEVAYGY